MASKSARAAIGPDAPAQGDAAKPSRFDLRKEAILNAAGGLFNRHGLRDTTLAVVASEIGLNLKSLRYYFERRDDLVSAAFLRSIERHRALVLTALQEQEFAARIGRFVHGYFATQARICRGEEPELVHFGDVRALTGEHLATVGDAYVGLFRLVRQLFAPGDAAWTSGQRSANAHLLLSQLHWSVIWLHGHVPDDYPRVAARLTDILLNGLAACAVDLAPDALPMPAPFAATDRLSQDSFLRAATTLINDHGYRGASVERISALLKVTKGAFYHHNETRDGLVVACFERTFDIIRQAQDRAMAEATDGLPHVAAATASLVRRQMIPEGVLLRTSALTAIELPLRREMALRLALSTGRFADMLNDGLIDGSVRLCDMRIASEAVTATINSAQELQRWVPSADTDNAAALYVGPLLYGFRGAAEGGRPL